MENTRKRFLLPIEGFFSRMEGMALLSVIFERGEVSGRRKDGEGR